MRIDLTPEWAALVQHADHHARPPSPAVRQRSGARGAAHAHGRRPHRRPLQAAVSMRTVELLLALGGACRCVQRRGTPCSAASTSTSPRTGRSSTPRCACPARAALIVDGEDVVAEVHEVLDRMAAFADGSAPARGPATPASPSARRQHRDRRLRPRAGDGRPRAAQLVGRRLRISGSCRTSTAATWSRPRPTSTRPRRCSSCRRRRSRRSRR